MQHRPQAAACVLLSMVLILAQGCGGNDDSERAQARAQAVVDAARSAGINENVTVDSVKALYGDSAPTLCGALPAHVGDLSSASQLLLYGNLGARRTKVVSDQSKALGRIVVQVYCPDRLDVYDRMVSVLPVVPNNP